MFKWRERCGRGVALEVALIKVRRFINGSGKWKKFLQKFKRITKSTFTQK